MSVRDLFVISLAVSLDAFGVAMALGLNSRVRLKDRIFFSLSFGIFQFLFSYIGGIGGKLFTDNIVKIPSLVGGIVIAIVGIMMIKDGMEDKEEESNVGAKMYLAVGVSVSIDASVVGFITLSEIERMRVLLVDTIFIGFFTFVMSIIAFVISKYLGRINVISRFADYIGGVILILFGLKMIFF